MTMIFSADVTCAVCGETSAHEVLASTNAMGYCDLDTRPPPMQRHTMARWIQRCPTCGHCAPSLDEAPPGVAEAVRSEAYRRKLAGGGLPALATAFACHAHLCEVTGRTRDAGWAMVRAAWVCDDADDAAAARRCREWALELLSRGGAGQEEQAGAHAALLVDLARRAGRLDEARALVAAGRAAGPDEVIGKLLTFQEALIDAGDVGCHTVERPLGRA
ncbi:MAG: hypothetical protein M9894_19550 [Planctomycetes bacterium]|nr:hypothetical protein [Planctomycetota bacterium]